MISQRTIGSVERYAASGIETTTKSSWRITMDAALPWLSMAVIDEAEKTIIKPRKVSAPALTNNI